MNNSASEEPSDTGQAQQPTNNRAVVIMLVIFASLLGLLILAQIAFR